MKKHIFTAVAFAICACLSFSSCQDEGEVIESAQESNEVQHIRPDVGKIVYDTTKSVPVSKSVIPRKYGSVYCYDSDLTKKQYTTLKIRNMAGTIIQEWLYENLNTSMFLGYHWSGDPDSTQYGTFYKWQGDLDDLTQTDWNFMMTDENDNSVTGFHIPTATDFDNLASIVGGSANIPQYLNLTYGSNYYPLFDDDDLYPGSNAGAILWENFRDPNIWTDYPNGEDPNRVAGCGVFYCWPKVIDDDHRPYVCYTNIDELGCNVRLVRTITMSQW